MKLKVSSGVAGDSIINLICATILFVFARSLNTAIGIVAIAVYCIWLIYKIAKKSIQVLDFLVMVPAVLLIGTNYLLFLGLVLVLIYGAIGLRKTRIVFSSPEVMGFTLMVLVGCISSELNATDIKSAHLYMGVYLLLEVMVIGLAFFRQYVECDAKRDILTFAWISFLFGFGYFMTHTVTELFNTAHIFIYYISNYGVYSNTLTGLMAPFVLGAAIIMFESNQKTAKLLATIGFVLMMTVMLAIQSRGAYLGMMVAVLWLMSKKGTKKVFMILVGLIIVILGISMFIPDSFIDYLFGRFSFSHFVNGDFSNGRWSIYKLAFNMFKEHPVIGCGFWQFTEYRIPYSDPHNFVLAYLGSTGIIGFTGFVIFLLGIYRRIRASYTHAATQDEKILAEIIMCAFITCVTHGLLEPSLTTSAPLSIFVIICNGVYLKKKAETNEVHNFQFLNGNRMGIQDHREA